MTNREAVVRSLTVLGEKQPETPEEGLKILDDGNEAGRIMLGMTILEIVNCVTFRDVLELAVLMGGK